MTLKYKDIPKLYVWWNGGILDLTVGMELFEEALRRWEQALTFRNRQVEDEASCSSIKLGAGDAIAEESVEVSIFNLLLLSGLFIAFCYLNVITF